MFICKGPVTDNSALYIK